MFDGQTTAPPAFHVMIKPRGPICNLDCQYCYYLSKERLYGADDSFQMSEAVLETFTRQYIEAQRVPEITVGWQGGEPTLRGLDFFKRAVELQQCYQKPGQRILNALQTNGTTLTDEWCAFLRDNDFLVGLSLDGSREIHDAYRQDKAGHSVFDAVMRGLRLLQKYGVEYNILTTVHAANAGRPLDVYRFLRDEVGTRFIQFIPIVERDNETGFQEGETLTGRSVTGPQYGQFLIGVFDEWVRRDVGNIFVQIFDVSLAAWVGQQPGLCVFEQTCGLALVLEHNGDLYACDHFVEPRHRRGNILEKSLAEMVGSSEQRHFGLAKRDALPRQCLECDVRFVCNGACPKNRIERPAPGEERVSHLCAGYKVFFHHIDPYMRFMANELRYGRPPVNIMVELARQEEAKEEQYEGTPRNAPCPCGSGKKYKNCHGKKK
ncbi:MAG: anaerobic sulfatase maturase [Anaerolineae bacterium]|nr:anaerobic sulfatase maturase [Anaerolineae bacterium]